MKFNPANNVQFDNLQKEYGVVKLERENNFKQYKVRRPLGQQFGDLELNEV